MSTVEESFLVGLIGEGVIPSLTPPMHEREADHQGLRYLYRPIDLTAIGRPASDIGVLLHQARDLGFNACNVTHPCKQEVLAHLDDISVTAAAIGAVNTVLITDGRLVGDNTDVSGFGSALRNGLPEADLGSVVLLGAGGAGAAVSHALLAAGVRRLAIVDLDRSRADDRAVSLHGRYPDVAISTDTPDALPRLLPQATGLVHATFVGMHSHPGLPVPARAPTTRSVGRRHRLSTAGHRTGRYGDRSRCAGARRRPHGDRPGGRHLPVDHRARARCRPDAGPLPGADRGRPLSDGRIKKTTATVCLSGTLVDKMHACAAAGFDGIELFEPDLVVAPQSPEEIRTLAERLGLELVLYQPFRDFEGVDDQQLAENLRRAEAKFALMQRLGIDTILVCSNVGHRDRG